MVDQGTGPAVLLIPGIQGHWEWMRPAVDALARRCRVLTDSLPGEPTSVARWDPQQGFEQFVDHVDTLLARASVDRAVICGVSFGGLIAVRYAGARPHRVAGLVLVSAPPPSWTPPPRFERYIRYPWLSLPFFLIGAASRTHAELSATFPRTIDRARFSRRHLRTMMRRPMSPRRAAQRMHAVADRSFEHDCRSVHVPMLIVTGERGLDKLVPVADTLRYRTFVPDCEHVTLERTGHLGLLTRPEVFADHVGAFARRCAAEVPRTAAS